MRSRELCSSRAGPAEDSAALLLWGSVRGRAQASPRGRPYPCCRHRSVTVATLGELHGPWGRDEPQALSHPCARAPGVLPISSPRSHPLSLPPDRRFVPGLLVQTPAPTPPPTHAALSLLAEAEAEAWPRWAGGLRSAARPVTPMRRRPWGRLPPACRAVSTRGSGAVCGLSPVSSFTSDAKGAVRWPGGGAG